MVAGIAGKREDRAGIGAVVRAQAAIQKNIVAPGALLTVLSGLVLTFSVTGRTGEPRASRFRSMVMQGAGLVGALLTLLIGLPTASRLARLDPMRAGRRPTSTSCGSGSELVASVAGIFALVALVAGAAYRYEGER